MKYTMNYDTFEEMIVAQRHGLSEALGWRLLSDKI